jgi:two-component system NtrC family sensor kinase
VEIRFTDTGEGIDEAVLDRIFDPFFTTKPLGKGTGLGLSICYGIIRDHNGQITVKSKKGIGTTFEIRLPLEETNG